MGVFEAIVVFANAWWIIFLPILGIGTHSQEEMGTVVPGSERGAPVKISLGRKALIATGGAALVTLVVWGLIHTHWLDFVIKPPGE